MVAVCQLCCVDQESQAVLLRRSPVRAIAKGDVGCCRSCLWADVQRARHESLWLKSLHCNVTFK